MSDQLLTFSFQDANLRGALVQTEHSFQKISHQHGDQAEYPLFIRQLLGEMNVLVLLMASNLKLQGTMSLQIRGNGYLYSVLTDATLAETSEINVRGIARRADQPQPHSLDLRDWVGNATLAITLQPNQGQPYQGVIPIDHPRLSQCIEDYYTRSEQIPTQFWTQITSTHCAGLMLQSMPSVEKTLLTEDSMTLTTGALLANTLKPGELTQTNPKTMLLRLFHEFPVLLHEQRHIEYSCACAARMEQTLLSLGEVQLQTLAKEDPVIEMSCQMCGALRTFDSEYLLQKFSD